MLYHCWYAMHACRSPIAVVASCLSSLHVVLLRLPGCLQRQPPGAVRALLGLMLVVMYDVHPCADEGFCKSSMHVADGCCHFPLSCNIDCILQQSQQHKQAAHACLQLHEHVVGLAWFMQSSRTLTLQHHALIVFFDSGMLLWEINIADQAYICQ